MRTKNKVIDKEIRLPFKIKKRVLAFGSNTKNTLCYIEGRQAYISRVHQDLSDPRDLDLFEKDARYFLKNRPDVIACDLHPDYASSRSAFSLPAVRRLSAIQHHHAHIASCMAENNLSDKRIIGVAFDGTGLGNDFAMWGAEFLICDYRSYSRAAHLKNITLPGGDSAIRQPWRIGAAWLYDIFGQSFTRLNLPFVKKMDKKKWQVLRKMTDLKLNSIQTSSAGRLFDAAASIIFNDHRAHSEAALAVALEKKAISCRVKASPYACVVTGNKEGVIIDPKPVFKGIIDDIKNGVDDNVIAYRFHASLADIIGKTCVLLRRAVNINRVVLSGGVFQNSLLLGMASELLYKQGFEAFRHGKLSCNDAGISLGEAIIAGTEN